MLSMPSLPAVASHIDAEEKFVDAAAPLYDVDDRLEPLAAIQKYCCSQIPKHRLAYAQSIAATLAGLDASSSVQQLLRVLHGLLKDDYADVRLAALQQATSIVQALSAEGCAVLPELEQLLETCQPQLLDADAENQAAAVSLLCCLLRATAAIAAEVAHAQLLACLQRLRWCPEQLQQDAHCQAVRLLAQVVQQGQELQSSAVAFTTWPGAAQEYIAYAGDLHPVVRQEAARHLPSLMQPLSHSLRERLWEAAWKLCQDSQCQVRCTCPAMLTGLLGLEGLSSEHRATCRQHMATLCNDPSPAVRQSALSQLGPLIVALQAHDEVHDSYLLQLYALTAHPAHQQPGNAGGWDLPLACAQHLGQVVQACRPEAWPLLRPAWQALCTCPHPPVLQALLAQLPLLSDSLGRSATVSDLLPGLQKLLDQRLGDVAVALVAQLGSLVVLLPAGDRRRLLHALPGLSLQPERHLAGDWRTRAAIASRLPSLAAVCSGATVAFHLWPLLLQLAADPVAAVRSAAASQAAALLARLAAQQGAGGGSGIAYESSGAGVSSKGGVRQHGSPFSLCSGTSVKYGGGSAHAQQTAKPGAICESRGEDGGGCARQGSSGRMAITANGIPRASSGPALAATSQLYAPTRAASASPATHTHHNKPQRAHSAGAASTASDSTSAPGTAKSMAAGKSTSHCRSASNASSQGLSLIPAGSLPTPCGSDITTASSDTTTAGSEASCSTAERRLQQKTSNPTGRGSHDLERHPSGVSCSTSGTTTNSSTTSSSGGASRPKPLPTPAQLVEQLEHFASAEQASSRAVYIAIAASILLAAADEARAMQQGALDGGGCWGDGKAVGLVLTQLPRLAADPIMCVRVALARLLADLARCGGGGALLLQRAPLQRCMKQLKQGGGAAVVALVRAIPKQLWGCE